VLNRLGIREGVSIEINSDVPNNAGLGSSSSLAVALTKALAETFNKRISLTEINDTAFELEKIIHGTPSGGDNSTSCYGGLLWFKKTESKNIAQSMKEEVSYKLENFVLVNVGQPEKTTGEMIQLVRNLPETKRAKHVKAIGAAAQKMRLALREKDMIKVRDCMNIAQENLTALGVSTPAIDRISKTMRDIAGAAKLCGAGGGGIVLCYHHDKKKLVSALKALGYEPIEAELGVEGVRIEKK
jgi:mevalonate kinase